MTTTPSAIQLKEIFRTGWNHPARVENYVDNIADKEFSAGRRAEAWKRVLADSLGSGGARRILDVGTGPGVYACMYSQLGHECVGLDFSEAMVNAARKRANRLALRCSFILGDAEAPPFSDASFDAVSSRHVLYTLPHPGVAVRQWMRVLRAGGMMILIGDQVTDCHARAISALWLAVRKRIGIGLPAKSACGWSASPEYHRALAECPLSKYHVQPSVLRAVMEAAGLESIRSVSTEEVQAARAAERTPGCGNHDSARRPFILTGIKP